MITLFHIIAKLSSKLPLWGLGGFLFLTISSCSKKTTTEQEQSQDDLKRLTIASVPTMDCLPLFIAYEAHFADSLGYRLRIQQHLSLSDCDTAFIHGSVCAAPSDYIHAQKLMSDSTIIYDNPNAYLSMFINQKGRLKEAKQLTDKMVACDRHGVSGVLAAHVLDSVKLTGDKSFLVNFLDLQLRLKMLQNNEMDAVILPEPQATQARQAGNPSVYTTSRYAGKQIGRFATRRSTSELIRELYNRAVDSLNIRGIHHYDSVIVKHLFIPKSYLPSLPSRNFKKL